MKKIIFAVFVLTSILQALDSLNIRVVDAWPYAGGRSIASDSNFTYLGIGGGLWIFNTINPSQPIKIGEFPMLGLIRKIIKRENFLYFTSIQEGFKILNVSNPNNPVLAGCINLSGAVGNLFLSGECAYIAKDRNLLVVNIQNPYQPFIVGSCTTSGLSNALNVYVTNNRAYIRKSYPGGFRIIDVSNPQAPIEIGGLDGDCRDIIVRDNIAFVGGSDVLKIYDVTNPQSIVQLTNWYWGGGGLNQIYLRGNLLYICSIDKLTIVDISNIQNPVRISWLTINNNYEALNNCNFIDTLCYVACTKGIVIISVADSLNPRLVGGYSNAPGWLIDIALANNNTMACITTSYGVWILDVSNHNAIHPRSIIPHPRSQLPVYTIEALDTLCYFAMSESLWIVSIANPDIPRRVGVCRIPMGGWPRASFLYNNRLYLGDALRNQFIILDVSNPSMPSPVGTYPLPPPISNPYGLYVVGDYAYFSNGHHFPVPDDSGGLLIFNVANPTNIQIVARYSPPFEGSTDGIYVVGSTAYLCDKYYGILILNIANPANPTLIGQYPTTDANDIIVRNGLAFLGDGDFGIRVLDISNLSQIRELGYYTRPGNAGAICVVGNYIFSAHDYGGFVVYEYYGSGIEEITNQSPRKLGLRIFPRPTKHQFLIEYDVTKDGMVGLDILDTLGRVNKTIKNERLKPGNYKLNYNTSDLPAGVYFIRLKQDKEEIIERMVIVK